MGPPNPAHRARPSPDATASRSNSPARNPHHPPLGPTPETRPATRTRTSHSVLSATPTTGVPCGDPPRLEPPPDAMTRRQAATATPPAEPPNRTSAEGRYIPGAANRSGGSPGTRTEGSGSDSANLQARAVDPPCAHNSRGPKVSPSHNADRSRAGKPRATAEAFRDGVKARRWQAQSAT